MKYRFVKKTDHDSVPYWLTQSYSEAFEDWSIVPGSLRTVREEAEKVFDHIVAGSTSEPVVLKEVDTADRGSSVLTTDTSCARCGKRIVLAGKLDPLAHYRCTDCLLSDSPPRMLP